MKLAVIIVNPDCDININGADFMPSVQEKREEIEQYFAEQGEVIAAYLFGSHQTEYETPMSDVDFAVLFSRDKKIYLFREMEIMSELSRILKYEDTDLVNLNKVPILLQHEIISSGRLLYEKDKNKVNNFVYYVLTFAYDEKIRAEKFYRLYEASLKEEYLDE